MTNAGERILAAYDEWGIAALRRHQLVWSAWKSERLESADHEILPNGTHGVRIVEGLDGTRLRLFFLSVLWRAAATALNEFSEIRLSVEKLERLRQIVAGESDDRPYLFPCLLNQIATKGPWHNQTPLAGVKKVPRPGRKPTKVRFFRFYFDGLAIHFHRDVSAQEHAAMGKMAVGSSDELGVLTVTYEASFQKENLETSVAETIVAWPTEWQKLVPKD